MIPRSGYTDPNPFPAYVADDVVAPPAVVIDPDTTLNTRPALLFTA